MRHADATASIRKPSCCMRAIAATRRPTPSRCRSTRRPRYQFRRHAARRQPVRAEGARQHLHPHHEPDHRRAGAAPRRARRRRRRRWRWARARRRRCSRSRTSAHAGDNIVSSTDLYGGTWNLFANTLKDDGHRGALRRSGRPRGFPPRDRRARRALLRRDAAQPEAQVFPIAEVADDRPRARRAADHGQHRLRRCCAGRSSTARRSSSIRPPSISAAMAPRSAACWSTAATSTGRSTADALPRCSTQPDPSYHGAVWTQAVKPLGPIAYIIKARVTLLRDLGACDEPVQRLPVHPGAGDLAAAHARALPQRQRGRATSLEAHPTITKVIYPGR